MLRPNKIAIILFLRSAPLFQSILILQSMSLRDFFLKQYRIFLYAAELYF